MADIYYRRNDAAAVSPQETNLFQLREERQCCRTYGVILAVAYIPARVKSLGSSPALRGT